MRALHDPKYVTRVPVTELKEGHAYVIKARNGSVGVYRHRPDGSTWSPLTYELARNKWGETFIDTEYDYSAGAPFGTVTPLREIGAVPDDVAGDRVKLLEWIQAQEQEHREWRDALCRTVLERLKAERTG